MKIKRWFCGTDSRRKAELAHSYEKFRFTGTVDKLPFEELYGAVRAYIQDVLPEENP
mgnify:CR=1 FL=1